MNPAIRVSYEAERGCGMRKVGGLYLVGGKLTAPCCVLPFPLKACPVCGGGIRPSRGWRWVEPRRLFESPACERPDTICPVAAPPARAGLIWIGEGYYASPTVFAQEAAAMGVSRRVAGLPKGLEIGKTWCFLAHRRVTHEPCPCGGMTTDCPSGCAGSGMRPIPGIFGAFVVGAVEKIVSEETPEGEIEKLVARGIQPVLVRPLQQDLFPEARPEAAREGIEEGSE